MDVGAPTRRWQLIGVFTVVILVAVGVYFWNLGKSSIANADEGVHTLVTRGIRERGDWLTLYLRDKEYFRKPPLSFWVRAVTENLFRDDEFFVRLPSALAGVGTVIVLTAWAWLWTRRTLVVLAAGSIFPFLPITFTHTFRTGETDGILIFLLTLAAFLLWRSMQRPWLAVAAAGVIGLAFMTKSVAAGVVPFGFGIALALNRQWPYTWKQVLVALSVFIAVVAPWHVQQFMTHGSKFWNEYVGYHILQRVETRLHTTPKQHGPLWYVRAVEGGMFPWSWLIVPAAALAVMRIRKKEGDPMNDTLLLSWGIGTIVLFSLAATKLAWYVAPAYPAFTLLIVRFLVEPFMHLPRWLRVMSAAAVIGYLVRTFGLFRTGASRFLSLEFLDARIATLLVVVLVTGILVVAYHRSVTTGQNLLRLISALVIVHIALVSLVVFSRNIRRTYESPYRVFRNEIVSRDQNAKVNFYHIGYITSPLAHYYLGGPNRQRELVPLREKPEKLEQVLTEQRGAFLIFKIENLPSPNVLERLEPVKNFKPLALYRIR